jgi:hypothetical protein
MNQHDGQWLASIAVLHETLIDRFPPNGSLRSSRQAILGTELNCAAAKQRKGWLCAGSRPLVSFSSVSRALL